MTGVKIEVPEMEQEWSEPFKLPRCGKMARMRELTVGESLRAQRMAGPSAADNDSSVAMVAAMTEVDGRAMTFDGIKALKMRDFGAIMKKGRELGFLGDSE